MAQTRVELANGIHLDVVDTGLPDGKPNACLLYTSPSPRD